MKQILRKKLHCGYVIKIMHGEEFEDFIYVEILNTLGIPMFDPLYFDFPARDFTTLSKVFATARKRINK